MRRIILVLFILFPLLAQADTGYQLRHRPGDYFTTGQDACNAGIADAQAFEPYRTITAATWVTGGCRFTTQRKSDNYVQNNQNLRCTQAGTVCYVDTYSCTADEPTTLTWPLGRQFTNGAPYQDFGFGIPAQTCISGCRASIDPNGTDDIYGLTDEQTPNAEIVWTDLAYKESGATCPSSEKTTPPEIPPAPADPCLTDPDAAGCSGSGGGDPDPCEADPQAEGCTGGGDTGGGDTGGGDTGGGDTGGGDTGGGDTGGGDTGGGDTGGGDTGTDDGAASGTACGTALSCTGDAVGCAIARIQKDFSCAMQDDNDFPAQKDELNQLLGDPQLAPVEDDEINVGELFDRGTRFLPSACPPPESLSLITNGGRSFEISYQPLCQLASDLGYLIVVAASIFYALYVGRSVGGE